MKTFGRRAILVIAIITVLLGGLYYAIHFWFMRNYGAGPEPVPSAILDVDRNFNFPKNFPPDPGADGKKTIDGIDSDHDGVRDDVQRWIYAFVPNDSKKQMSLRQMARVYQGDLRDDFDSLAVRRDQNILSMKAIQCMFRVFDDEMNGYREALYLKAKVFNTYSRTVRYWENNSKVTTREMSGERPKFQEPCDSH